MSQWAARSPFTLPAGWDLLQRAARAARLCLRFLALLAMLRSIDRAMWVMEYEAHEPDA